MAVKGIGLTGQMHGPVLLDENGEVLRPSILWNDQRTGAQCDAIRSKLGREKLIQITGNDALTGEYASDRAGGAGTILFDLAKRDWSPEVLDALDIPAEYLPQACEGTDVTGTLSPSVAD